MKSGRFMIFLSLLVLSSACWAVEEEVAPMKVSELPEYHQLRDPFWPIDYARKIEPKVDPTLPKPPVVEVKIKPKWPKLKLKAVTSSPTGYFAIIEGVTGVVESGQIVRRTVDGIVYSWRIDKISKRGFSRKQLKATPEKK